MTLADVESRGSRVMKTRKKKLKTDIFYRINFMSDDNRKSQNRWKQHIFKLNTQQVNIDHTEMIFYLDCFWSCVFGKWVIWSRESFYSGSFFPWLLFDILRQVQMCLAYRSLRAATNKYGVAHDHTLSRFPRKVGNVRSRQRCSQMSVLCWVL